MSEKWERVVVENVSREELSASDELPFSAQFSYDAVIEEVRERRKTEPNYLFTDREFPPRQASLVFTETGQKEMPRDLIWHRPHEISHNASFLKDGFSREDVTQGQLSDCYLLAALASLATKPKAMRTVVPKGQVTKSSKNYTGAFHFRFWQFGKWYDVVVDDWLPCCRNDSREFSCMVAFGYSMDIDEFWISLAEKAYAKLYGSYEALNNGLTLEALEDLTGGIAMRFNFRASDTPPDITKRMRKAVRNGSWVSLSISGTGEFNRSTGLQSRHSYSVTLAEQIKVDKEKIDIFRVRNPWGLERFEWKLDWSDDSMKWSLLKEEDKERLEYPAGRGEWYMSAEDIGKYFDKVTICTVGPDFDEDGVQTTSGYFYSYANGSWIPGYTAGGPYLNNYLQNFLSNPQYLIRLLSSEPNQISAVIIGVMQRYTRLQQERRYKLKIGYRLYEIDRDLADYLRYARQKVPFSYHYQLQLLSSCDDCRYLREVTSQCDIVTGKDYLYLPFTSIVGQSEDFLVRIYSEGRISLLELL